MVKVVGKYVNLIFMKQCLKRDWTIQDIEDYSHALIERYCCLDLDLEYPNRTLIPSSTIGHMLKIDRIISIYSMEKFVLLGCELNIEYKGLYQICFTCEKYGHRSDQCSETPIIISDDQKTKNTG
ncbi:hypothetical protein Ahy_A04g020593 [Arachis hypogaea]|uniref:CCHC-type domain-containing protein n=1 Tax=Arachis hypogaea TaxID=3818 RepID=A0A445DI28_ARAHY|nr:hypothetical protein Ahy_A04g020593 [Arachis hypogaea]